MRGLGLAVSLHSPPAYRELLEDAHCSLYDSITIPRTDLDVLKQPAIVIIQHHKYIGISSHQAAICELWSRSKIAGNLSEFVLPSSAQLCS
jgi:hypothetical protein